MKTERERGGGEREWEREKEREKLCNYRVTKNEDREREWERERKRERSYAITGSQRMKIDTVDTKQREKESIKAPGILLTKTHSLGLLVILFTTVLICLQKHTIQDCYLYYLLLSQFAYKNTQSRIVSYTIYYCPNLLTKTHNLGLLVILFTTVPICLQKHTVQDCQLYYLLLSQFAYKNTQSRIVSYTIYYCPNLLTKTHSLGLLVILFTTLPICLQKHTIQDCQLYYLLLSQFAYKNTQSRIVSYTIYYCPNLLTKTHNLGLLVILFTTVLICLQKHTVQDCQLYSIYNCPNLLTKTHNLGLLVILFTTVPICLQKHTIQDCYLYYLLLSQFAYKNTQSRIVSYTIYYCPNLLTKTHNLGLLVILFTTVPISLQKHTIQDCYLYYLLLSQFAYKSTQSRIVSYTIYYCPNLLTKIHYLGLLVILFTIVPICLQKHTIQDCQLYYLLLSQFAYKNTQSRTVSYTIYYCPNLLTKTHNLGLLVILFTTVPICLQKHTIQDCYLYYLLLSQFAYKNTQSRIVIYTIYYCPNLLTKTHILGLLLILFTTVPICLQKHTIQDCQLYYLLLSQFAYKNTQSRIVIYTIYYCPNLLTKTHNLGLLLILFTTVPICLQKHTIQDCQLYYLLLSQFAYKNTQSRIVIYTIYYCPNLLTKTHNLGLLFILFTTVPICCVWNRTCNSRIMSLTRQPLCHAAPQNERK